MDRHAATRRLHQLAGIAGIQVTRAHPHMLRHTFVTTMLDAGVDLRDVQIAARHADPRTTMRYDRARQNLDVLSSRRLQGAGLLKWASHCSSGRPDRVLSRLTLRIRRPAAGRESRKP
jgi:hypothetical protein